MIADSNTLHAKTPIRTTHGTSNVNQVKTVTVSTVSDLNSSITHPQKIPLRLPVSSEKAHQIPVPVALMGPKRDRARRTSNAAAASRLSETTKSLTDSKGLCETSEDLNQSAVKQNLNQESQHEVRQVQKHLGPKSHTTVTESTTKPKAPCQGGSSALSLTQLPVQSLGTICSSDASCIYSDDGKVKC